MFGTSNIFSATSHFPRNSYLSLLNFDAQSVKCAFQERNEVAVSSNE